MHQLYQCVSARCHAAYNLQQCNMTVRACCRSTSWTSFTTLKSILSSNARVWYRSSLSTCQPVPAPMWVSLGTADVD